jgi:P-type Ca2+ transporter type 2C
MTTTGLSVAEAARRLAEVGPNEVRQRGRISVWSSIGVQLRDPLILVLLAACALTILIGDLTDAAVIALVVVVNTTVGVAQEVKADRAITALAQMAAPTVRVRRDSTQTSVPVAALVPGDVVVLGEGDIVPADCALLDATSLLVDESALTGESVAVGKAAPHDEVAGEALSSGTVVVKGRALATVTMTGASSALGRIAELMDSRVEPTPLQRRLAGLGRVLALVAIALCSLVLVLGLARGQPLELMVVTAISLAVAAVPESLPAVVTLSLALGARRMAARHAVVRRLPAVETLGSVTVLATDKTGTLTEAQMLVEELWTPTGATRVTGDGYSPDGILWVDDRPFDPALDREVVALLRAGALCNDATLVPPADESARWSGLGDPTEVALLTVAAKAGLWREPLEVRHPRLGEVPFDSADQRMSTLHAGGSDGEVCTVVVKGSIEALRARHSEATGDETEGPTVWARAADHAADLAGRGFRVLAVAAGEAAPGPGWDRAPLQLLGLVAMTDPAKPAARATILEVRRAGIVPVLITGDHPATASAIAARVGVIDEQTGLARTVVTGGQIASGEVGDLTAARVYARTTPEQKLDIVQAWKSRGAVVAMTGDGVNDGPALRRADIGVAMGHRGTEVARQAADLVLADDDLETLVAAVREGRRVYANIRMFLVFGLSGGAAEILVMLLGPLFGLTVPLVAAQILWINLLTHGITGVALGAEPAGPRAMERPPRPPEQSVLGDGLWQRVVVLTLVLGAVALGLGTWASDADRAWQTMIFLALTSLQLGVALGLRPRLVTHENPLLPLAVLGSFLLGLAGVYVPLLQQLLGTVALPPADVLLSTATVVVGWAAARLTRPISSATAHRGDGQRPAVPSV